MTKSRGINSPRMHRTAAATSATPRSALRTMPEADVFTAGNSYLGLLGQATHSHKDRATVANVLRGRGYAIKGDLTKIYRKATTC